MLRTEQNKLHGGSGDKKKKDGGNFLFCPPCAKTEPNETTKRGETMAEYRKRTLGVRIGVSDYARILTVAKETRVPMGVLARGALTRGLADELSERKKAFRREQATIERIEALKGRQDETGQAE